MFYVILMITTIEKSIGDTQRLYKRNASKLLQNIIK